ncbi:phenylacetic acid degradation operon negative regulatory protein PaaX [Subtercola frigoramans]
MVFTLFGDYLRYIGHGEAKLGALSELLGLFDVDAGTTRVVMTRLKKDGWFDTRRDGRETSYLLSEKGWRLMNEGRARIFVHPDVKWSGEWAMVSYRFPDSERAAREAVRKQLSWLGFGQLTPSIWMSPHDRIAAAEALFEGAPTNSADMFYSRGRSLEQDRDIARRCWDLDALNEDYRAFIAEFCGPTEPEPTGVDALIQRVRIAGAYRLFPFRDPDLPIELLPADWRGHQAHEEFTRVYAGLTDEAESALERITGVEMDRRTDYPPASVSAKETS